MKLNELYELFVNTNYKVSTDSRDKSEGALFFALKGDNFNGNKFASIAIDNGASYAIIDEKEYAINNRYILVDDVLSTLQDLARYHRQQFNIPVIGITGTNGKTTTKELTACVLSQKYNVLYTEGNFNNHIGVPLTLMRLREEHEIAIIEMGANHPGEIRALSNIACPTAGLITNVGKAHLEGFGSLEGVIMTKKELYQYLRINNGTIFANENNQYLRGELIYDEYIKYGVDCNIVDIHGHIESSSPFVKMSWNAKNRETQYINTQLIGEYNAENILAAITIGTHYGVNASMINAAIDNYAPSNSRSQLKQTDKNTLIIDAYNANPTSMSSALKNFNGMEFNNKCVILGDMLELGEQSIVEHINIIQLLNNLDIDDVILVGAEFYKVETSYAKFKNCDALIEWLEINPIEGKTILLKGSNGIKLKNCIDKL